MGEHPCKQKSEHLCAQCGKAFRTPAELRRHQNRKTPCAPIVEHQTLPPEAQSRQCRFCGRLLASRRSMYRHMRDSCKIAPTEKNGEAGMELLYEHTIRQQQKQITTQQAQIQSLLSLVERMGLGRGPPAGASSLAAPAVGIFGGANQVNIDARRIETTVVLNVFGKEQVGHVTPEIVREILAETLRESQQPAEAAQAAVLKTAQLVYSNPDHPENLTCYLSNKRQNEALVHTSRADGTAGWEVQPVPLVLPPIAKKSVDTLFERQPYDDARAFEPLLKELRDNEPHYAKGAQLRTILVRNKQLLKRADVGGPTTPQR